MNKTKKLTTGAMLLAIVGALMLLDRQFSYLFDVYIVSQWLKDYNFWIIT